MPCQLLEEPWRRLAVKTRLPRPVPDPDERAVAPRRGSEFFSICFLPPARSPVPALRGCRPGLRGETGGRAGAGVTRGLRTPRWACGHVRASSVIVPRRTCVSGRGPWNRDAPIGRSSSQRPWGSSQRPWGKAETKSHFPLTPALRPPSGAGGPQQPGSSCGPRVWSLLAPVPTPGAEERLWWTGPCRAVLGLETVRQAAPGASVGYGDGSGRGQGVAAGGLRCWPLQKPPGGRADGSLHASLRTTVCSV